MPIVIEPPISFGSIRAQAVASVGRMEVKMKIVNRRWREKVKGAERYRF
jgi:hypothetical protein